MIAFRPQYVVDETRKRTGVLLPLSEWEQILEELEQLDDLRAYDEAKAGSQEAMPFDQAVREIDQDYG